MDHFKSIWQMAIGQNKSKPWHLVNPKIAGKWMFIPLELIIIGFDPPPNQLLNIIYGEFQGHGHGTPIAAASFRLQSLRSQWSFCTPTEQSPPGCHWSHRAILRVHLGATCKVPNIGLSQLCAPPKHGEFLWLLSIIQLSLWTKINSVLTSNIIQNDPKSPWFPAAAGNQRNQGAPKLPVSCAAGHRLQRGLRVSGMLCTTDGRGHAPRGQQQRGGRDLLQCRRQLKHAGTIWVCLEKTCG